MQRSIGHLKSVQKQRIRPIQVGADRSVAARDRQGNNGQSCVESILGTHSVSIGACIAIMILIRFIMVKAIYEGLFYRAGIRFGADRACGSAGISLEQGNREH